jgi:hypothetical protein
MAGVSAHIGQAELDARNKAVAKENKTAAAMRTLIRTRARQLKDEPPPPDLQVAQDATRAARTRRAWAEWHRDQAQRHRRTLADLIVHHEREAERLGGTM